SVLVSFDAHLSLVCAHSPRFPLPVFSFLTRRPPSSTLFPYTTLFRSLQRRGALLAVPGDVLQHDDGIVHDEPRGRCHRHAGEHRDRKSTRLNSSHVKISYAVFCLKKKKRVKHQQHVQAHPHILSLTKC